MKTAILFALFAAWILQLSAAPVPQQQPPAQKARIEGSIVRSGNGNAMPRARITLTRSGAATAGRGAAPTAGVRGASVPPAPIPPVVSDDQGRFSVPDLDEGTYTIQVLANGYVNLNYGQHYTGGPGIPIALKAGQLMRELAITLTPASNISGRIRDRADQPLANVPVQLLRYTYNAQGQRNYQTAGTAKTDDRGEYRIYWMTPGSYYLMAGNPAGANSMVALIIGLESGNANPNDRAVPLSYAYYPGVPDIGSAQVISLQPGADVDSVNFVLTAKPPSFRIRGRVVDIRNGRPPTRARVGASPQALSGGSNQIIDEISMDLPINSYEAATGIFEIRDVAAGNYVVTAIAPEDGPVTGAGTPPRQAAGMTAVTVANADVENVTVTVIPPTSISGKVRADGTLPVPLERIRFQLTPLPGAFAWPRAASFNGAAVAAAADGSFTFPSVPPGDYRLVLQAAAPAPAAGARPGSNAMYINEARFDGADILNSPLRIAGSVTSPIEIAIGIGGGQISGVLSDQRGQPVPVSQIVIVPDRARNRIELYRTSVTDANGGFIFSGIVPGDYRVFSWEGLEPFSWFDPEVMAQSAGKGRAIHVTEASSDTIDVRLISKDGTQ